MLISMLVNQLAHCPRIITVTHVLAMMSSRIETIGHPITYDMIVGGCLLSA